MMTPTRKPKLSPTDLYLGDNGRCFCGEHAGASAKYTGRDISGQRVHKVSDADRAEAIAEGFTLACETPGCERGTCRRIVVEQR